MLEALDVVVEAKKSQKTVSEMSSNVRKVLLKELEVLEEAIERIVIVWVTDNVL